MKATGIVRRIDELGRVVIPKEIRRTLRMREGDPLEIFVDRNGEVVLKKYSPIGEMTTVAKEIVESMHESAGHITIISDKDEIIALAGVPKAQYLNKQISETLEDVMEDRRTLYQPKGGLYEIAKNQKEEFHSLVVAPIVAGGDPVGTITMINPDPKYVMSGFEKTMAETAATFLSKHLSAD